MDRTTPHAGCTATAAPRDSSHQNQSGLADGYGTTLSILTNVFKVLGKVVSDL